MFDDFLDLIKTLGRKLLSSRLAALAVLFSCMFLFLVVKLFNLQIVNGESYLKDYIQLTEREVTTPGTRGKIFDRNGNVLAYNELAYTVTVQDNGEYATTNERNAMESRWKADLRLPSTKTEKCTTPPHQRHPESGFSATSTDFAPSTSSPGRTEIIPPTSPPGSCLKTE